jgi:hypothetical protein
MAFDEEMVTATASCVRRLFASAGDYCFMLSVSTSSWSDTVIILPFAW